MLLAGQTKHRIETLDFPGCLRGVGSRSGWQRVADLPTDLAIRRATHCRHTVASARQD